MRLNSKIYIAGHKGLVGSAIWNNLLSKGYSNLIGRTIDELDLLDQQTVGRFFAEEKPEYVVLAAAKVGGIVANNTYRGQFIYENLQIQNNVIHQAYLHGVKKLLFLGSTCIYPREAPQPMKEDCLLTGPLEYTNEPYAIAKIAGLKLCESYNLQYGTDFIAVMPTNLYGPNDNFDLDRSHVLPAMIRKIYLGKCLEEDNWEAILRDMEMRPVLNDLETKGPSDLGAEGTIRQLTNERKDFSNLSEETNRQSYKKNLIRVLDKYGIRINSPEFEKFVSVEVWGSGKPMREFLWSEDMADACVFVLENIGFRELVSISSSGKGEIRNIHLNIGTGKEISILDLAFLVKETIGFRGKLTFDSSKPDGTMRKLTDPSKLQDLGWHHKIEIEEGVKRLADWYITHV